MERTIPETPPTLQPSIGLSDLVFYGTGTILGAGIFVVVGQVVGQAGGLAPIAYAAAGAVALCTALSFAELGARIPSAGGPIDYVDRAFGVRWLATAIGLTMTTANIVSGATIATGFTAYLTSLTPVSHWVVIPCLVATFGLISISGMKQSARFMMLTTGLGILTLIYVIWALRYNIAAAHPKIAESLTNFQPADAAATFSAAFLAIYAFIGFGDMALTAEEVRNVKRTLPRGIMISLGMVFVFYFAIASALAGAPDIGGIARANAPLAEAVNQVGGAGTLVAVASLFIIVNGGLSQIIAASRLIFDLARDGRGVHPKFSFVSPRTKTPVFATLFCLCMVLLLALFVPLKTLATLTSFAILIVFIFTNASLWCLKLRSQPHDVPNTPIVLPVIGVFACSAAVLVQLYLWLVA